MSPLVKLAWLKDEKPDLFLKSCKVHSHKGICISIVCFGEYVVDYSIASATGMFHLENLAWDEEALKVAGVRRISFPSLFRQRRAWSA